MGIPLRVLQVAATLVITLVTGLLFYLPAAKAFHYMHMVVTRPWQYPADYLRVLVYTLCVLMLIDLPEMLSGRRTHLADRPWQLRSLYYAALILLLIFTWTKDYESFMYFQF